MGRRARMFEPDVDQMLKSIERLTDRVGAQQWRLTKEVERRPTGPRGHSVQAR